MESTFDCLYYDKNINDFVDYKCRITFEVLKEDGTYPENYNKIYDTLDMGSNKKDFMRNVSNKIISLINSLGLENSPRNNGITCFTKEDINDFLNGNMEMKYNEMEKGNKRKKEQLMDKIEALSTYLYGIPSDYFIKNRELFEKNQELIDPKTVEKNLKKLPWDFNNLPDGTNFELSPSAIFEISDIKNVNMKSILLGSRKLSANMKKYLTIKDIINKLDKNNSSYKKIYKELNSEFLKLQPDFSIPQKKKNHYDLVMGLYKQYEPYLEKKYQSKQKKRYTSSSE